MSPQKPSIVFCHGIWADGSCFSKLIVPLRAEGFEVITAQYGLDTHHRDVEVTRQTLSRGLEPLNLGRSFLWGRRDYQCGN